MKCPHCGANNPIRQVYCSGCGKKMSVSFDTIAESVGVDKSEGRYAGAARALIALTVLAAMAGVGVWMVSSRIDPQVRTEGALVPAAPPPDFPAPRPEPPTLPAIPGSPESMAFAFPPVPGPVVERFGCRRDPVRKSLHEVLEGDPKALEAIAKGLECLRARQSNTGAWKAKGAWEGGRLGWGDVGVTGLAVLALLGDGHVWGRRDRLGHAAGRGVRFLLGAQAENGCIGGSEGNYMYNHGIAATALVDAYAVSGAAGLREPAQKAIRYLLSAQRASGGWDYTDRPGTRADVSVSAWQIAALCSGAAAGLDVPEKALTAASGFLASLTSPTTAETGYEKLPRRKRRLEHPTLGPTAIALACRVALAADRSSPMVPRQAAILLREDNLPRWQPEWSKKPTRSAIHVYYYWYHGTMAMRGIGGGQWRTWNKAVTQALLAGQKDDGSWPRAGLYAQDAGRIYATALAVLTLETTYRYP
ncbi:MAG: hypothetical protein ACYSU0_13155 [Planctomycetota bacterium]|jgi:hypothetical protein